MQYNINNYLLALCVGILCLGVVMFLQTSGRRLSLAMVIWMLVFATMGALLAGFISAAATHRTILHHTAQNTIAHIASYVGVVVGSLFGLWVRSRLGGHSFRAMGPVGYSLIIGMVAAVVVFFWVGIPGYMSLSAHQPPSGWHPGGGNPYPADVSSEPPWYALIIAAYLASLAFAATFAIMAPALLIACKIIGRRKRSAKGVGVGLH